MFEGILKMMLLPRRMGELSEKVLLKQVLLS